MRDDEPRPVWMSLLERHVTSRKYCDWRFPRKRVKDNTYSFFALTANRVCSYVIVFFMHQISKERGGQSGGRRGTGVGEGKRWRGICGHLLLRACALFINQITNSEILVIQNR
jgi:hypothetical protein